VEAAKVSAQDPLPPEVLVRFRQLYAVGQEARQAGLVAAQRLALRQQKSVPLMAALKERLVAIRQLEIFNAYTRFSQFAAGSA
jgi:hypothetical protein